MAVTSHRDLIVWQKSMDLAEEVYRITNRFPRTEMYRLTDQMCRAAISVSGCIAEGHERSTAKDFANYLAMAKGSLMETETYLLLAVRLEYVTDEDVTTASGLILEVSKMLTALRRRLLTRR